MKIIIFIVCCFISSYCFSQDTKDPVLPSLPVDSSIQRKQQEVDSISKSAKQQIYDSIRSEKTIQGTSNSSLSPLLTYNFAGEKNGLSNLTPVINYGWKKTFKKNLLGAVPELDMNPYAAGQIRIKDSNSYIPALMLPGIAGININLFLHYDLKHDLEFLWYPINLGLKLNSDFLDSNKIIVQHNIRTGIGLHYMNWVLFGIQYTYGWHNMTSESQENFKQIFHKNATDIHYLTITLSIYLKNDPKNPNILFAEFRGLINKEKYLGYPNIKILTFGFKKELNLSSAIAQTYL